jgi:hypothetical protein
MAGIFGDINNRADFFRKLAEATTSCRRLIARFPRDLTLQSVLLQLETIAAWTGHGRVPSQLERKSLDLSLRMFREYETTDDDEIATLSNSSSMIHSYVEQWPSDVIASDPTNSQYLRQSS